MAEPEPTAWELQRSLQQIRSDMRDGVAGINGRLDKLASAETVAHIAQGLANEVAAREAGDKENEAAHEKLVARVWWVAATLVLPVALFAATMIRGS